jgi:cytochrome c peroxidase
MHNGVYATLQEVVDFYDRGGGAAPNKDPALRPLNLRPREKEQLVAFLLSLSGEPLAVERPVPPPYQAVAAWDTTEN